MSYPPVTEMFHFTGFAKHTYLVFNVLCHGFTMAGTPIRRSSDQSLLSNFPRHIAANHALHRFQLPRCPPFALAGLV